MSCIEGNGFERHSLYCTKCRTICWWSIIIYFLFMLINNMYSLDFQINLQNSKLSVQSRIYILHRFGLANWTNSPCRIWVESDLFLYFIINTFLGYKITNSICGSVLWIHKRLFCIKYRKKSFLVYIYLLFWNGYQMLVLKLSGIPISS